MTKKKKIKITSGISERALQCGSVKFDAGRTLIGCKTLSCTSAPITVTAARFTDWELRLKHFTAFSFVLFFSLLSRVKARARTRTRTKTTVPGVPALPRPNKMAAGRELRRGARPR